MNKKLLYSFKRVIEAAKSLECKDLVHKNKQLHHENYMCPVVYELNKHICNKRIFANYKYK